MKTKELARTEPKNAEQATSLTVGKPFSLTPTSLKEAMDLAKMISESDLAPKDFKGKAANCLIAMQMGMEVGLAPMQAIQNIAVINSRPTVWGDAAMALVLASPICAYVREEWDEKSQTWTVRGKRKDDPNEGVYTFSMADAVKAGLANKEGPWKNYPKRMIQMRARAFLLRDKFADVLKGLAIREEVADYVETTGTTVQTPKAKVEETPPPATNGQMLPGELSFFKNQLARLGANMDEVQKCAVATFGVSDLAKLTKEQAKHILSIWKDEPAQSSESAEQPAEAAR